MTLIVGAVCKDAIVLGAESETTRGNAKYQGAKKLTVGDFTDGSVIVGEAGIQFLSRAVIDRFVQFIAGAPIENEQSVGDAIANSFRQISKGSIAPQLGTKKCQEFYRQENNYFEITLAFYCGGQPYIYVFNPSFGIAVKCPRAFSVSGVGEDLAEYLLKDVPFGTMDSRASVLEVAHVVREVKTSVSGCGGNTEIALVSNGNKPETLSPSAITVLDEKLRLLSEKRRSERKQSIEETKNSISMEYQNLSLTGPVED